MKLRKCLAGELSFLVIFGLIFIHCSFSEFFGASTMEMFRQGFELRGIDRGALMQRLRRRQGDFTAYVRSSLGVGDSFTPDETLQHLEWLTIGTPAPPFYVDCADSVSTISTGGSIYAAADSAQNEYEDLPVL